MAAVNLRTQSGQHNTAAIAAMLLLLVFVFSIVSATKQPNIVVIMADDLGFNDVSFRGSVDIPTPNIDALAYTGRILNRHYVLPTCTPSRTALLTGKYPLRTGMQGYPLKAGERRALPVEFTLLPEYLKNLGYSTHLIGKWHQGFYQWKHTPTYRGFDSFFGYYNGFIGYWDHDITMSGYLDKPGEVPANGIDLRRNKTIARDVQGIYATELFTNEAERVIQTHNKEKPLFIDLSHLAVHTGKKGTIVEVENEAQNDKRFWYLKHAQRRRMAGAMISLDKSVGRVIKALAENDMLQNTIILFLADNGGETIGIHSNAASNYPLRGQKFTQFEGGVRGAAVIWHAGMEPTTELHTDLIHISDWLPTFFDAAGGNVADLDVDGVSQWGRLSGSAAKAPRTELLVNSEFLLDTNDTVIGRAYIDADWKLVWGVLYPKLGDYSGESGRTEGAKPYDFGDVVDSETTHSLLAASKLTRDGLLERAQRLRKSATLPKDCREGASQEVPTCLAGCLYNLRDDPCETRDVASEHPDIVASLKAKLNSWQEKAVPQLNTFVDPKCDPRRFGRTWMPWEDVRSWNKEDGPNQTHQFSLSDEILAFFIQIWTMIKL